MTIEIGDLFRTYGTINKNDGKSLMVKLNLRLYYMYNDKSSSVLSTFVIFFAKM